MFAMQVQKEMEGHPGYCGAKVCTLRPTYTSVELNHITFALALQKNGMMHIEISLAAAKSIDCGHAAAHTLHR
jgi:hypothetical protein